jgi:diaminopimelate epimerase
MQISKYNASGNDFIIFHSFLKSDRSELAKRLCSRHSGVGADGMIVLLPHKEYDYEWEFYNSDGSTANMCGNGARAASLYALNNSLALKEHSFVSGDGVIKSEVSGSDVEIRLTQVRTLDEVFEYKGFDWHFYDSGVPHLVTYVDDLSKYDNVLAKELRELKNANVNFVKIEDNSISVRTYERGVEGETLACGTGMAASFFGAFQDDLVSSRVFVYPSSKERLELSFRDGYIYLKGRVQKVFETSIDA